MRKLLYAIALLGLAAAITGCHATEKQYRSAYEKAMAGRAASLRSDSTVYMAVRQELAPGEITYQGRTFPAGRQHVSITDGGGGINEYIKKYCVVAGSFKQAFNAKSMRERLADNGYPGAFVVHTREPYYFVVAGSSSEPGPAVEVYDRLKADSALMLREPMPFILMPAQIP